MRLQVFLSHSGLCSRRNALEYVLASKVTVNGKKITEPSYPVSESDVVVFDGKQIFLKEKIYILLNKPKGVTTTTSDRFAEEIVLDLLPKQFKHLYPVGRLDKDTTGLLVLTNDGDLAHRLAHPSFETEKTYKAILNKPLTEQDKKEIENGIFIEGKKTAPAKVKAVSKNEYEIIIHEGRKRQVRRMFAALHYFIKDLARIKQGALELGSLKIGEWRFLTKEEVERLYAA